MTDVRPWHRVGTYKYLENIGYNYENGVSMLFSGEVAKERNFQMLKRVDRTRGRRLEKKLVRPSGEGVHLSRREQEEY